MAMYIEACRGRGKGRGGGEAVACMYYIWQCTLGRIGRRRRGERGSCGFFLLHMAMYLGAYRGTEEGGKGKLWLPFITYGNVSWGV